MTISKKLLLDYSEANGNVYDAWARELVKMGKAKTLPPCLKIEEKKGFKNYLTYSPCEKCNKECKK